MYESRQKKRLARLPKQATVTWVSGTEPPPNRRTTMNTTKLAEMVSEIAFDSRLMWDAAYDTASDETAAEEVAGATAACDELYDRAVIAIDEGRIGHAIGHLREAAAIEAAHCDSTPASRALALLGAS